MWSWAVVPSSCSWSSYSTGLLLFCSHVLFLPFFIISYKSLRIFLLCNCVATILLLLSFYMFLSFSFIVILFLLASHVSFISGFYFLFLHWLTMTRQIIIVWYDPIFLLCCYCRLNPRVVCVYEFITWGPAVLSNLHIYAAVAPTIHECFLFLNWGHLFTSGPAVLGSCYPCIRCVYSNQKLFATSRYRYRSSERSVPVPGTSSSVLISRSGLESVLRSQT